jgi:peptidase M23-like protein
MVYPAGGSMVIASGVDLGEAACTSRGPSDAHAELRSLSLFGGAVTAAQVRLTIGPDASSVDGLAVEGKPASPRARRRLPVKRWGYVTIGSGRPLLTNVDGHAVSALAVHLLERHDGLPAGTVVLVSVAGLPAYAATRRAAEHHRRVASHEPLKVTPPLGQRHFVFPVAGPSDYIDTYGAFRSDVPGNWHHGDDIFAPLGTPVVAVASGTINRVGWEHVGGWRLWVRDEAGDEFYYAHLSGYAPTDLHSDRVRAGEVIGFIGNTGDAFSTSPHLHFEVHPRQLLHLGYDGAVDPTRYLNRWTHLKRVTVPTPTHPPFPSQPALRQEAGYVWRELLAARHLTRHAPPPSARPHIHIPIGANGRPIAAALPPIAVAVRHESSLTTTEVAVLAALVSLAVFAATILGPGRLRRLGLLRTVGRHDPDKDE